MREHWLIPDTPFGSYGDYRRATGPSALEAARAADSDAILHEVQASGLRGRGGAGFPTGTKWRSVAHHECLQRSVVCNAAEGEPGTFKDRWLLRHNPYAVIEGMLIAAHVVGTRDLHVAIKASFEPELARLQSALDEMGDVMGDCAVRITTGPDEYLFGEEKALLEVIEGGEPMPRPPHYPPYERGLFATGTEPNPALVNNAETFGHIPSIMRAGAASFRQLGTQDTPGTCLYTISGDVRRPGIYERQAGVTLRELLFEAAGGPLEGRTFRALLAGVASPVITPERFDTPADFGALQLIGSGLGSAGFVAYDDMRSMPRLTQSVSRFLYVESCNQCSACKTGLRVASEAIDELFDPDTANDDDVPRAIYGARSAPQGNRCYLPVQGSILIPSLLETFAPDFDAILREPGRQADLVPVPKLVDYDPGTHTFVLDADQERKQPDWTFTEPHPRVRRPSRPAVQPRDVDRAPTVVRLRPDIADAIQDRARDSNRSAEQMVDAALREWLGRRS